MELRTLEYLARQGWSAGMPVDLDSPNTLVLAFGASALIDDPRSLREVYEAFPRACKVGCSTAGEIAGARVLDDSVTVAVAQFKHTALRLAEAPLQAARDSYEAGRRVAAELSEQHPPRAILVLSDGVRVNGSDLIRGINSVTAGRAIVTGGLAGDGDRFRRTWVSHRGKPEEGRVAAVGFYGDELKASFGSHGGWDIFGPERRVTRSVANILYEIDGKPALALYKRYLGDRAAGLPATALLFPLAMRLDVQAQQSLVRTILSVDESEQSMVFAGDIPEGSLVQLMRANFDRLIEGAATAARKARDPAGFRGSTLAIAISCVGRRLVLGERAEEEIEVVRDALPEASALVGFYSYGEFSPNVAGSCDFHNQTMTLTTLAEQ